MFSDLTPYRDYSRSGDQWFGDSPVSWKVRPMRSLFAEVRETGHSDESLLSVTIARGIIRQIDLLADSSKRDSSNLDKSKYKLVESGDIAYNKMRAWQGALGVSRHRGIVSPAYVVVRLRDDGEGQYFHHLLRTPAFAKEAERWSYGITSDQWSLRPEHFRMINCPVPSLVEQAAIVKYIGHANARINRAIASKRKLVALLEEQKQAIINQAVTRGLDPAVPMKDSGIPWLGQIPAHWLEVRLRSVLLDGPRNGVSPRVEEEGDLQSFSISAVRDGVLDVRAADVKLVASRSVPRLDNYSLRSGDILLVRGNGNIRLVGRAGLVMEDMPGRIYPDLLMRMRINAMASPPYIVAVLNSESIRRQTEIVARTAVGTYKVNGQNVRQLHFALPTVDEQTSILSGIEHATSGMVRSIKMALAEIELLREFRTRLTADVVTGQLDVREAAARLPELDLADLVSDVGQDEDDLDAELAESLEAVEA